MFLELIKYAGSGWIPFLSTMSILCILGIIVINTISIKIHICQGNGEKEEKADKHKEGDNQ